MNPLRKKLCVAGAVLALAIGYLAYAGVKLGRSYYLQVDAFLADSQFHSQRVRLHGKVGQDNLVVQDGGLTTNFQLLGQRSILPVVYTGAVPDLFKPDCEVVVEGLLGSDGVFKADQLLTKCASKYDQHDGDVERPT